MSEVMLILSIVASVILVFVLIINVANFASLCDYERKAITKRLGGLHIIFYFIIPFYYQIVIRFLDTLNPSNPSDRNFISKMYFSIMKPQHIKKCLDENENIIIVSTNMITQNTIDYSTHKLIDTSYCQIEYCYENTKLDRILGKQKVRVTGAVAQTFMSNRDKRIVMKESEFKIMMLNECLNNLTKMAAPV